MIALPDADLLDFTRSTYPQHHLGIEKSTIEFYATVVNLLNRFAARKVTTRELSEELLVEFLNEYRGQGRAAATVNSRRSALCALWSFAHKRGLADEPCPLPRMKLPKRKPTAWRLEQMEALMAACYQAPSRRGWDGRDWASLVLTIYDTALRINAVLSLRCEQFDLARRTLVVDADQQKDDEEASYALHEQTAACLVEALISRGKRGPRDLIFPFPFSRRQIWPQFKRILDQAGLPSGRRDLFHRIRRTSASWLESVRPGAAQAHLGHGDAGTTRMYLDQEITGTAVNAAELLPRFRVAAPVDPQRLLF